MSELYRKVDYTRDWEQDDLQKILESGEISKAVDAAITLATHGEEDAFSDALSEFSDGAVELVATKLEEKGILLNKTTFELEF